MMQKELFNSWNGACDRLRSLNGVVQNDLDRLLADRLVTKQEIEESIKTFREDVENRILEIKGIEHEVCQFLSDKSR